MNARLLHGFLFTFLILLSLFGALSAGFFILFETKKGQDFLLTTGEFYLKKQGVYISVEGLQGDFPKNFTLQKITLSFNPQSPSILILHNIDIHFKWYDLLKGMFTLTLLKAETIDLSTPSETEASSFSLEDIVLSFKALSLPPIPLAVNVHQLEIMDFSFLNEEKKRHLNVKGRVFLPHFSKDSETNLFLQVKDLNFPFSALLDIHYNHDSQHLNGLFEVEEVEDGFLKFSHPFRLKGDFQKEEGHQKFKGHLTFESSSILSLEGTYALIYAPVPNLIFEGHFNCPRLLTSLSLSPLFDVNLEITLKNKTLSLPQGKIIHENFILSGEGYFPLDESPLDFQGTLDILGPLFPKDQKSTLLKPFEENFPKHLFLRISGIFKNALDIICSSNNTPQEPSLNIKSHLNLENETAEGTLEGQLPLKDVFLKGGLKFIWAPKILHLNDLKVTGPLLTLQGNLTWENTPLPLGDLTFSLKDLSLLNTNLPGGYFTGTLISQKEKGLSMTLEGKTLHYEDVTLDHFHLKATSQDFLGKNTNVFLTLHALKKETSLLLEDLQLTLQGDRRGEEFPLKGRLNLTNPETKLILKTGLDFLQKKDFSSLSFTNLEGHFGAQKISLTHPLILIFSNTGIKIQETCLKIDKSSLLFSFEKKENSLLGHVSLKKFPLSLLSPFNAFLNLPLSVGGEAHLKGDIFNPLLTLNASLKSLKKSSLFEEPLESFKSVLSGSWNGKKLSFKLDYQDPKSINRLHLTGDFPLFLENGVHLFLSPTAPLRVSLSGNGDLETCAPLLPFFVSEGDFIKGEVSLSLLLEGTLHKKRLSGTISLQNGHYENFNLGSVLEDISLKIQGTGDRFQILHAQAHDQQKGTLTLKGSCSQLFSGTGPDSYNLEATLTKFHLVSLDIVKGEATGTLNLIKHKQTTLPTLTGNLTVSPLSVHIPKKLPNSISVLPFTRDGNVENERTKAFKESSLFLIHAPKDFLQKMSILELTPPSNTQEFTFLIPSILLNIKIAIPSQFSVEGWGLTSLWAGDIIVGGTLNEPKLNGNLSLELGHYVLFGKTFSLTQGSLFFTGESTIDPKVNVTAQITTGGIIAQVLIDGRLMTPQFTLKSQPNLPPGEIASRILFGKGIGSLSPFQSLQIVSALGDLTGTGSPLNVVDDIRNALGLGGLSFTAGENGNGGVSLGQFLSDNVSLSVSPDLSNNSAQASVEIRVLPNITLQSDINTQTAGGAGVNWQWDYD